jgi:hypothetical protein
MIDIKEKEYIMKTSKIRIFGILAVPLIVAFALFMGGCEGAMEKGAEVSEEATLLGELSPDEVEGEGDGGLRISNSALLPGIYGTAYSETIAGEGGSGNYVITLEGLPSGLSFSENAITGTPEEIGSFSLDIQLTDSDTSESVQKILDLLINKETPTIIANKMAPDLWLPIQQEVIEEELNTKLLVQVEGNSPGYTWSLVEAPGSICLSSASYSSDMFNAECNHPLNSTDQSNTVFVFATSYTLTTPFEFKVRVESPYSNPAEKTIKYTGITM